MAQGTARMAVAVADGESGNWEAALQRVAEQLADAPQLVVLFFSGGAAEQAERLAALAMQRFPAAVRLGCSAESLVADSQELEGVSAMVVWAACLPGTLEPIRLEYLPQADGGSIVGLPEDAGGHLLVLADPFSFPVELLLDRGAEDLAGLTFVGGMASGGTAPGEHRLLLNQDVLRDGAVAVHLPDTPLTTLVSQGCRPIGSAMVVTAATGNVIETLGGHPAYRQLQEVFAKLPNREQMMMQQGVHLGRVVSEYQESFSAGEFLIRNVLGGDPEAGTLTIADYFRVGQTVQFHLRDAVTATDDLQQQLQRLQGRAFGGGLLFTCNGRGTRLFPEPHHDAAAVQRVWPGLPLAGFFAQGEIGPVGPRSFLHGFTASLLLFDA